MEKLLNQINSFRFVAIVFAFITLSLCWLSWHVYYSYNVMGRLIDHDSQMIRLRSEVVYLDEILTLLSKVIVNTGKLDYFLKYKELKNHANQAVNELMVLSPIELRTMVDHGLNSAKLRLETLEREALDLVTQGQVAAASQILAGQEYQRQRSIYLDSMKALDKHLEDVKSQILRERESANVINAFLIVTLISSLIGVGFVFRYQMRTHSRLHISFAALRNSEKRFRDLALLMSDWLWEVDSHLRYTYCSEKVENTLGFKVDEILGNSVWNIFAPQWRQSEAVSTIRLPFTNKQPLVNVEGWCVRKDGEKIRVVLNAIPIFDEGGAFAGYRGVASDVTQRRQAEEALRISEERFELAMRGATDGLWDWDITHNTMYYLPRLREILGLGDNDIGNQLEDFLPLIHPEDLSSVLENVNAYLEHKKPSYHIVYRVRHKRGHYIWVQARGIALWDAENKPVRFVGTLVDITAQKEAEEALRISEERFELAVQGSRDGVWDWNIVTDELYYSPSLKRIIGFPEDAQVSVEEFNSRVHPEDVDRLWMDVNVYLEKHTGIYENTHRFLHKQGYYIWMLARGMGIWDESTGKPLRLIGTYMDLTTQKQTEETLRRQEEFLRLVIDSVPIFIHWKDVDGAYLGCNKHMATFAGLSTPGEIIGKTDWDLPWKEQAAQLQEVNQSVIETGIPLYHALEKIVLPTSVHWLESNKIPLKNGEGKIIGILTATEDITQRKQSEELLKEYNTSLERKVSEKTRSLREKERFLRLIIDNIPQYLSWKDTHFKYLGASRSFIKQIGIEHPEEIVGKQDADFFLPMEVDYILAQDKRVLATGMPLFHQIESFSRRDNTIRWVDTTKVPLLDEEGHIIGILGSSEDITARKQAEESLRLREQQLTTILNTLPVAVWFIDRQGNIVLHNPTAEKIWGTVKYDKDELGKYKAWWHGTHQPLSPEEWGGTRAIKKGETSLNEILDIENFDGARKTIISSAIPLINSSGLIYGAIVINEDITERIEAEQALRESEERFALAMQGANDGLWDWNMTEMRKTYFSPRFKEIIGFADHEFPNDLDEFTRRIHPEDAEQVFSTLMKYLRREINTYEITYRVQHKEGHYIWNLLRGTAVWNNHNEAVRVVGTMMDLTAQKQSEQALMEAKEAAEIANLAKSAFLANMSHELRTPLNGILGYAQILNRDRTLTPKQREGIDIIQRSGEYLLTLINDVLDLSKIEAGRAELYPIDFNFNEFIQGIGELFQMRTQQKGIAFNYEPLSRLPVGVRADEKRLRQILINLLGNAVKFTEQGGITFKVGYQQEKIRFQIEDTGIGIEKQDIDKIFQPFQQVGEYSQKAEGTGLGLAITKRLIEMMGGELQVESSPGCGSVFSIVLDLPESEVVKPKEEKKPIIIGYRIPPHADSGKEFYSILVVDDKTENRSVLVNLLTPLGFKIVEAIQGADGLEKIAQFPFDLIITDLVMPVLDGFEFTRRVRQIPTLENIPIIVVSASVFNFHQQESLAAGCNDFVPKPFRVDELLECLQRHLNIDWIYEEANNAIDSLHRGDQIHVTENTLITVGPSPEQAAILLDLAMCGDINGILNNINDLEQNNKQLAYFAHRVRQLAKDFDEEKICELVQGFI